MWKFHFATIVILCWHVEARIALAQPALEKLENLIRGEQAENAQGSGPSLSPQAPAVNSPPAPGPSSTPGYLGIVADNAAPGQQGAHVLSIRQGSPGERAGLAPGDLITAADGVPVQSLDGLSRVLERTLAGQAVIFDVIRDGAARKVKAVLGSRPQPIAAPPMDRAEEEMLPMPPPSPPSERPPAVPAAETPPPAQAPNAVPAFAVPRLAPPAIVNPLPENIEAGPDSPAITPMPSAQPPSDRELLQSILRRLEMIERRLDRLEQQSTADSNSDG